MENKDNLYIIFKCLIAIPKKVLWKICIFSKEVSYTIFKAITKPIRA